MSGGAAQRLVVAEHGSDAPRKRANPMPNGHLWQYACNQVDRRVTHATAQTAGAKTPTFTAKGDEHRVPAALTQKLQAAVLEEPALQVSIELLVHEFW